jgi:hypothetical protein
MKEDKTKDLKQNSVEGKHYSEIDELKSYLEYPIPINKMKSVDLLIAKWCKEVNSELIRRLLK